MAFPEEIPRSCPSQGENPLGRHCFPPVAVGMLTEDEPKSSAYHFLFCLMSGSPHLGGKGGKRVEEEELSVIKWRTWGWTLRWNGTVNIQHSSHAGQRLAAVFSNGLETILYFTGHVASVMS